MSFRNTLFAALCLALACTSVFAQSSTSGHTLEGTVRDTTGAVMVDVAVVLAPSDAGEARALVTDASGRFEFHALPSGTYRVSASAVGFAEGARAITLANEPRTAIELILQVVVTETVEVTAEVASTTSAGLASTTLTGAALEALPDDPGALLQRVRELAGATDAGGQVTLTIDGFREGRWLPPKQAIQAIRISSNWFAAEFAEPGQARIDIITKPGSSSVHGDLRLNFNHEAMNARNALAVQHPSGHMRDVTGYLSGPIVPGRWSFVLYAGQWALQQQRVINATVLDRSYRPVSHVDNISAPSRVNNLWLGTTYQVAPMHTLALSFSRTTETAANLGLESGIDLLERAYRRTASDTAVRATLTSVPSTRAMNELRVEVNPQESTVQAASAAPAFIVFEAFNGGGNQDALFSATRHVDVELFDSITLFVPRHTLKAGLDVRSAGRHYRDRTNFGGVFAFGASFDGDGTLISPLETYRRTLLGLPGYGASQFWMTRGNPDVRFRQTSVGAYAQDDWMPVPRVTVSYGLRSDWQSAASQPGLGARTGVALALDSARRNVVRVGAGTFYQQIEPELTLDVTRLDGRHQEQLLVTNPSFFPAVPADMTGITASIPTIYVADSGLRAPQVLMSAAGYDRVLSESIFLKLTYGYQHGTDLLRTRNISVREVDGPRPEAQIGRMLRYESTGRLRRHELSSGWRWNAGARGSFFANYSYVHGRSNTDSRGTIAADEARLGDEFGPIAADRAHSANMGAHFSVPGGLVVSPYLAASSGHVFNITTGFDNNGDGVFTDRPAAVDAGTPGAIHTPYGSFLADRAADALMVPRNFGRDPAMVRMDLRVSRAFRSLVVAASVENLLNRANFEGVNGVITSPSFGQPKRAGLPRHINLSVGFSL